MRLLKYFFGKEKDNFQLLELKQAEDKSQEAQTIEKSPLEDIRSNKALDAVKSGLISPEDQVMCGSCKGMFKWENAYYQTHTPESRFAPADMLMSYFHQRTFCPICGHVVAERSNREVDINWAGNARPTKSEKLPTTWTGQRIYSQGFEVPQYRNIFDVQGYVKDLKKGQIKSAADKDELLETKWDDLWPSIESPKGADLLPFIFIESPATNVDHKLWEAVHEKMTELKPIGRHNAGKVIADYSGGEHWIGFCRRAQGTLEGICDLAVTNISGYCAQLNVESINMEDSMHSLKHEGIDNLFIGVTLVDIVIPLLILKADDDLYCCVYAKPQD